MIELNGKKLCSSCFKEIGMDSECNCRYYNDNSDTSLEKGTILNGRYIVGMQVESSETFKRYLCYDSIENITVFIKEFFSENFNFKRNGSNVDVNEKSLNSYNFAMQKAIEATKKAQMINSATSPTVLKAFFENNTAYFVTEVHILDTVSDYTKINHCISCEEAVNFLHQFLTFLSDLNNLGIMHGCINDKTVYINKDEGSVFIDGFDCDVSDVSADTVMIINPDSYSHIKKYTAVKSIMCDVFSVGAVLYKLLTRKTPEAEGIAEERFDSFAIEKIADKDLMHLIKNMCGFNKWEYSSLYDVISDANLLFRKYRLPAIEANTMITLPGAEKLNGKDRNNGNSKKIIIIALISFIVLSVIIGVAALTLKNRNKPTDSESTSVSDIVETDESQSDGEDKDKVSADKDENDKTTDDKNDKADEENTTKAKKNQK